MASPDIDAYDKVPYTGGCHREAHVDHLHALARLAGLDPAPPSRCRYLEIGCAVGTHLLPMALSLPGSTFVGIDPSPVQIEAARARAAALGMDNVALRCVGAEDLLDEAEGSYDYIACHGVWSWVSPPVQAAILAAIGRLLAPDGVAYLSYNVLPGWYRLLAARDLMRFHTASFTDPRAAIQQARAMVDLSALAAGARTDSVAVMARELKEELDRQTDPYVLHEFLAEHNTPVHYSAFVRQAADAGLAPLGDAADLDGDPDRWGPEVSRALAPLVGDPVRLAQYMDFLSGRSFRRTVLARADRTGLSALGDGSLSGLLLAGPLEPEGEVVLADDSAAIFSRDGTRLSTSAPLSKAGLLLLSQAFPACLSFDALVDAARAALPDRGTSREADAAALRLDLMSCVGRRIVLLRSEPPPWATTAGPRPRVHPLARLEATVGDRVTSLMHADLHLQPIDLELVRIADGSLDREGLADGLLAATVAGRLTLSGPGAVDPERVRAALLTVIDLRLPQLARLGLLIP